ncbi:MAG: transcriptional regulator [Frondihabitans sp.]|nr:transcriptional regulator [Frondihabitans sp.]
MTQHEDRETRRVEFAEEFALAWSATGSARMEGRVLGYLMVMPQPYISLSDLSKALHASAGSTSQSTRHLLEVGFIRRHAVPGDRAYYFKADEDIWGGWLARERGSLPNTQAILERQLAELGTSPEDAAARIRLENGRDYLTWLHGHHHKMLEEWEAFKAARDAGRSKT